jgi:DNA-binding Xre family transcriptional regulator
VHYNVSEAMEALPGLQTGLNVNVRFNNVDGICASLETNMISEETWA